MNHRVYIAGPYSAISRFERETNVLLAAEAAVEVMRRGHDAHCPHTATHLIEEISKGTFDYERWMRLDFGIIRHWATAVFVLRESPGANREAALARELGLPVWTNLNDVPVANA